MLFLLIPRILEVAPTIHAIEQKQINAELGEHGAQYSVGK